VKNRLRRRLTQFEHALLTVAGTVMITAFIVVVAGFTYAATRPDPWTPLYGPVAGQTIDNQTQTTLIVNGQKCSRATRPVWVQGTFWAQPVNPRGFAVKIGEGETVRLPGCTPVSFTNVTPDAVLDYTKKLGAPVTWYFTGTETPVGECAPVDAEYQPEPADIRLETTDGAFFCWRRGHGESWTWTTENFTLPTDMKEQ